jgi:hypothetical protein
LVSNRFRGSSFLCLKESSCSWRNALVYRRCNGSSQFWVYWLQP